MPPWPYVRVFIWRTTLVWSALHVVTLSLVHTLRAFVFALAVTVILLLLDAERRNERRFLANLGVSRLGIGAVVLVTAISLEAFLRLIAGGLVDS